MWGCLLVVRIQKELLNTVSVVGRAFTPAEPCVHTPKSWEDVWSTNDGRQSGTWLNDTGLKQTVSVLTSKGEPSSPSILSSWEIYLDLEFTKAFTSEPDATFTLQSVNLMHCKPHSQVPYFWMFTKNVPLDSWLYVSEQMCMSSFACSWKPRWRCVWPNKLNFAVCVPGYQSQ